MPEISKIKLPSGNTYEIKDEVARTYYAEVSVTSTRDSETDEVTYSASIVSGTFAEIEAAMDAGRDVIVKAVYGSGSGEAHYFRPGYRMDGSELHFESTGDELLELSYILDWFPAHNGGPERVTFKESSGIYAAMDDGSTGNAVTSITQGVDVIGKHILTVHKDKTFVDTAAQTLTSSQKAQARTNIGVDEAIADAMKGGYVAVSTLPTASEQTMGHIYLIPGTSGTGQNIKIEYVTIRSGSEGAYTYTWEELGTTELNLDNLNLAKGSGDNVLGEDTTFTVSKPNINITGGTTDKVLGSDATFSSTVSGSSIWLTVQKRTNAAVGADGTDTFVKSYPGATSKLATTTVPNVTGNTDVTIPNVTGNTDVSIPNVTGNASKTLTFEMGTGDNATTLIIGGTGFASGSNTYTASAVTLGTALSASKVTLGTALSASKVTLGTAKTVATGSLTSSGSGADVMTGLGTPTTASALTGVKVTTQPDFYLDDENIGSGVEVYEGGTLSVTTTVNNKDEVTAVTGVGSAALASNPTVTVGSNDRIKIAKYDDLDLVKP